MNTSDEELQKKVERGDFSSQEDIDVRAYRNIFSALSSSGDSPLATNFADRVIHRIEVKQRAKDRRDWIWFVCGSLQLAVVLIIALGMVASQLTLGFLKEISAFAGVFAFGAAILITLHWIDKRMVHSKDRQAF